MAIFLHTDSLRVHRSMDTILGRSIPVYREIDRAEAQRIEAIPEDERTLVDGRVERLAPAERAKRRQDRNAAERREQLIQERIRQLAIDSLIADGSLPAAESPSR